MLVMLPADKPSPFPQPQSLDGQQKRGLLNVNSRDISKVRGRRNWVARIKFILPSLAITALLVGMLWPFINLNNGNFLGLDFGDFMTGRLDRLKVTNFKFSSSDTSKQPFNLTADRVDQQENYSYELMNPKADILMAEGNWAFISSDSGNYIEDGEKITLTGNVEMFHDLGYELYMPTMNINLKNGMIESNDPVKGQAAQGRFTAQGIQLYDGGIQVKLLGKSQMVID